MIKVGQIGIGHNHAHGIMETLRKFPELFEVIGYSEENPKWIKERGDLECYKGLPHLSKEEIIEKSDALFIECDVWNLTKTALECIKSGKHIHMDKPAGGSVKEFEELLDLAKEKNLVVNLGYMYRYNPAVKKCFELIKNGDLGEIYSVNAEMSTYHSGEYRTWLKNFKGGIMYILGSHLVDLVVYMLGEPKNITSIIKQSGSKNIHSDDNNFAVLEYEKAIAKITVSSVEVNGYGRRQLVVSGEKGTVEIKPMENPTVMTYSDTNIASMPYEDMKEILNVEKITHENRYDEMMQDFYDYVTGRKKNPYTYKHDLTVHKVLTEIVGGMEENGKYTY